MRQSWSAAAQERLSLCHATMSRLLGVVEPPGELQVVWEHCGGGIDRQAVSLPSGIAAAADMMCNLDSFEFGIASRVCWWCK